MFDKFISWAKKREYRNNVVSNKSINQYLTVLGRICQKASIEYRWNNYNPFFGYRKLPERDSYEDINPFSVEEQLKLIENLPNHWKPFFKFAFASGLRQGEQLGLKYKDIDWDNKVIHIKRAITKDQNGKTIEGTTKTSIAKEK